MLAVRGSMSANGIASKQHCASSILPSITSTTNVDTCVFSLVAFASFPLLHLSNETNDLVDVLFAIHDHLNQISRIRLSHELPEELSGYDYRQAHGT